MAYITPKQLFINDRIANGGDPGDVLFLAELEFDQNGDVKPGSIIDTYSGKQ